METPLEKFTEKGKPRCCGRQEIRYEDKSIPGYYGAQCKQACLEGSNLCKYCTERLAKHLTGIKGKWHGRIGENIPTNSAIYKTIAKTGKIGEKIKALEESVIRATTAAVTANAVAGAGAPPAVKRAAKTAKRAAKAATEATEEGVAAVASAVAAEQKARKAAEKALREATAAAKKAEREAAKEAEVAERAAKVATRSSKRLTAKQRTNAHRRRLRNAYRAVQAGENVNVNTRMAADAYKMLRLAEMEVGNSGASSNTVIRRKSSSSAKRKENRIMYRPASAISSNTSAGYASAASGSAPRPAPRPASAASPIGSDAFESEKRRAAQNAALASIMAAQGPANLY